SGGCGSPCDSAKVRAAVHVEICPRSERVEARAQQRDHRRNLLGAPGATEVAEGVAENLLQERADTLGSARSGSLLRQRLDELVDLLGHECSRRDGVDQDALRGE